MGHPTGIRNGGSEIDAHDPAISAFLYLGETLKALSGRGGNGTKASLHPEPEATETLLRAIEGEIIPRLMLVHRGVASTSPAAIPSTASLDPSDRARFLDSVMRESATASLRLVDELLERGVSRETVFLDLLTHTARRLGELWEEDRCDFSDVTIGLCRLHEVLREYSVVHDRPPTRVLLDTPRILLATACSDQHVFGVVMVAEFFRRAGWRVRSEPGASHGQLATILAGDRYEVLGLSVACSALLDEVASEIATLRKASCNAQMKVLVGGRVLSEAPDLVARTGADGTARDGMNAPTVGNELLVLPGRPV